MRPNVVVDHQLIFRRDAAEDRKPFDQRDRRIDHQLPKDSDLAVLERADEILQSPRAHLRHEVVISSCREEGDDLIGERSGLLEDLLAPAAKTEAKTVAQ